MSTAALAVDATGEKHPLRVVEGATENAATARALNDNLIDRGARFRHAMSVHRRWIEGSVDGASLDATRPSALSGSQYPYAENRLVLMCVKMMLRRLCNVVAASSVAVTGLWGGRARASTVALA